MPSLPSARRLAASLARARQGQDWRTPSGSQVDFVWTRGKQAVGVEVKASSTWRREHGASLKALVEDGMLTAGHGVYTGSTLLKDGPIRVWPVMRFLRELAAGHVLG